jgi:hyperosmotically inducible protein
MKTTILAGLLATAVSASFAAAPTAALNHDPATYRNVTQKAAADYKVAVAKCTGMSGNAKDVCIEEAKSARAHAEADAIAQYNNTAKGRAKASVAVADADYALAKAKCGDMTGADKDSCMNNARSVRTAAVADAKAGRDIGATASNTGVVPPMSATARDARQAAAVEKCTQLAGQARTGCLIDNRTATTTAVPGTVASRTEAAADTAVDKTRDAVASAAEKTREVASTATEKTRNAVADVAEKTDRATDRLGAKSEVAAANTGAAVSDSVITTKVKADIFKEPELKSLAIHVETDKGVVMLSGFVDSKADADKAVRVARSVDGVTQVKSAIKVK